MGEIKIKLADLKYLVMKESILERLKKDLVDFIEHNQGDESTPKRELTHSFLRKIERMEFLNA